MNAVNNFETYGDLPENVRAVVRDHTQNRPAGGELWDNMTSREQRDWLVSRLDEQQVQLHRARALHRIDQRFFSKVNRAVNGPSGDMFLALVHALRERADCIREHPPLTGPKIIRSASDPSESPDT